MILFFDELPWLASKRAGFMPALEQVWNQYFSKLNNVLVVLCGSAAHWMIRRVVNNRGGLYGRLSEVIKLKPFSLAESEAFLQSRNVHLSRKALGELYMTTGGIAKYLSLVQPGESVAQAVNRLCFQAQGQLVGEFRNLYSSLFDNANTHMRVVRVLADMRRGTSAPSIAETANLFGRRS